MSLADRQLRRGIAALFVGCLVGASFADDEENNVPPTETEAQAPKKFGEKAKRGEWEAGALASTEQPCITWKAYRACDCPLPYLFTMKTRRSAEIKGSMWSVGCETLDRDYADFEVFGKYVGELGVKAARLFSGWAKTEQVKGVYDFAWIDRQVDGLVRQGVTPMICLSYGNPIYGSDFRLGMKVKRLTENPEALAAWLRYCRTIVARYRGKVDTWEIWNEPLGQGPDYAKLILVTGRAVKEVQPEAKLMVSAIYPPQDYEAVCGLLKKEGATDLVKYFVIHPYTWIPETPYVGKPKTGQREDVGQHVPTIREILAGYSANYEVYQGEAGCPAQLEFGHALCGHPWTEYSQAKWNLRAALMSFASGVPYNFFTMIDLQYPFMLQSFGLIRSNTLNEFIYRRPSFYAVRNLVSLFDDTVRSAGVVSNTCEILAWADANERDVQRTATTVKCLKDGKPIVAAWYSDRIPGDIIKWDRVRLAVEDVALSDPALLDLITGKVYGIPAESWKVVTKDGRPTLVLHDLPMRDSPVLIADRAMFPQ